MEDATQWLWSGWIPRGHLSMICGVPGSGKSVVATWLATTVLRGSGRFPDSAPVQPGSPSGPNWVSWVNTKSTHLLLVDRLKLMGAPLEQVCWPVDPDDPEVCQVIDLTQARWLELVASAVAALRPAWVIVDAIIPSHGEIGPGMHRALDALTEIARDVGCAVTLLYQQDVARATGDARQWAAIAGKMKTIISLKRWAPETKDLRFRVIKSDADERPNPLRIRIDSGIPEVVHRPLVPPLTAVDRAASYLEKHLAQGPLPAFQLIEAAKWGNGISARSLQRAKRRLGIRSFLTRGRWMWILSGGSFA